MHCWGKNPVFQGHFDGLQCNLAHIFITLSATSRYQFYENTQKNERALI